MTEQHVPWPLNDTSVTWWSQRYVTAAVGLAYAHWMSGGSSPAGYNTSAAPFVYAGAHITPWATDRHIPYQSRVSTWNQHIHMLIGGAVTDPWPNAKIDSQLGMKGLVLGAGAWFGDNVIAFTLGTVLGRGSYDDVDVLGISHNRKVTLYSPFLAVSTQADVVAVIRGIFGKAP